ncbi:MAG: insulinase family protein [Alphaproteobacteria bacterium]|nr:insulinase family protein [Alphaproteobacteria bacterium]
MFTALFVLVFVLINWLSPAHAFGAKPLAVQKGEDVWFAEDHTLPMFAVVASFPAGSAYDPNGKAGLAAFAAALMDEGAGNLNGRQFHSALADKAIQLEVEPSRDWTVVSIVSLSANAKDAFALLKLALTRPRFDADAIARVRAQMLQNIDRQDEDPSEVAGREFHHLFFGWHPYAHPVAGDRGGLNAVQRGDLKAFAAAHWVRAGLKIAVAGDIGAPALTAYLKSTFGALSGKPLPPLPPVGKLGAAGVHRIAMDVPQPNAAFGMAGVMRDDPDFIPAYVANYILGGGGASSRLTEDVREKKGLTYDISTELSDMRRAATVEGLVATRADAMGDTLSAIRDAFARFAAEGPTAQELTDAKTYLTGSYPLAFSSDTGTASQLGAFQRAGLDVGYVARRNSLIDAVTLDDVRRVARRVFDPNRLTIVVAGTMKK